MRGFNRTLMFLLLIVLLGAGAVFVDLPNTPGIHIGGYNNDLQVRQGLDLKGGIQFLLQAQCPADQPKCDVQGQMNNVIGNITRRLTGGGFIDPVIRQEGTNRVLVQLPGLTNDEQARALLGQTGQMYIIDTGGQALSIGQDVSSQICTKDPCPAGTYKVVFRGSQIDGSQVNATIDPTTNQPIVQFEFAGNAKGDFATYTRNHMNQFLTIVLDGKVIESATIRSEIDGQGQISGSMTITDAQQLASYLKYGALPLPLTVQSEQQLAPTLGQQAISFSERAAIIGLGLVVLFMLIVYRLPGLLADVALLLYALFLFATIKIVGVTLSLPGIAAMILTIGMAVDANILIFERTKEELRAGRTLAAAVDLGFKRAWPSIRDSNMSTMITCAILYWFGNNFGATIVVSFAISLFIGVAISLFTAIIVTRNFLNLLVPTGVATHPALFGLPAEALNVARYKRPVSRVGARPVPAAVLAGASGAGRVAATDAGGAAELEDDTDENGSGLNGRTATDTIETTRGSKE